MGFFLGDIHMHTHVVTRVTNSQFYQWKPFIPVP